MSKETDDIKETFKCYKNRCNGEVIFCFDCYAKHRHYHLIKENPSLAVINNVINNKSLNNSKMGNFMY